MKMLVVSDVHANWPALETVLDAESPWDQLVFCGDVVDYGPHPVECVRVLRVNANHAVRGNHDNALACNLDCRCLGPYRPYSLATRDWHRTLLDVDDIEYLRSLFTLDVFEWDGEHFRIAHATPTGDLFEYLASDHWEGVIGRTSADVILLGHTHIQEVRTFGRTTVINPGSVGLARDHGGEACYATIEDGKVTLRHIPYDVGRTIADLRESPLPRDVIEGLVRALTTGWPVKR